MEHKKTDEEIVNEMVEAIAPFAAELSTLFGEIEEMVEAGIITREQADDMTGASIDKMDHEDLIRTEAQVKCMAKRGFLDKRESENILRGARRKEEDYEALQYIGNRLEKAKKNHLLNIPEPKTDKNHELSQKAKIESFENDMKHVAKQLETAFGMSFDVHIVTADSPKTKAKTRIQKKRSK